MKLLGWSLMAVLGCTGVNARAASVWQIHASSASKSVQCSATLLNRGRCVLLTAAHCLPEDLTSLKVGVEESQVIRKSRFFDLAEITIPAGMKKNLSSQCEHADEAVQSFSNSQASLEASGYVAADLVQRYSKNLDWEDGNHGYSTVGIQFTANAMNDYLLSIQDLVVVPGMSGGLVQDENGSVAGMISQFVPKTGVLYAVPTQTMDRFINGEMPAPDLEKLTGVQTMSEFLSHNNGTHGAGNDGHVGGGNDGHVGGGNDGHVGGGNDAMVAGDGMTLFREPVEGIDDPENPGHRLMAVDGKQIDGTDDYALIYLSLSAEQRAKAKKVYQHDGLTRGILKRLQGIYEIQLHDPGKEIFYRGESAEASGDLLARISIDAKKRNVMMMLYSNGREERITWNVVLDHSGLPVSLSSGALTLQCDRREFLQLHCWNEDTDLSLSLNLDRETVKSDEWVPPKLHFRLTRKVQFEGEKYFDYRFGDAVDNGNEAP